MVMNVESQLYSFLVMLYGGIIIAILYDIYKLFRFILRPKRIGTDIGDIIYWILATIVFIFFFICKQLRGNKVLLISWSFDWHTFVRYIFKSYCDENTAIFL